MYEIGGMAIMQRAQHIESATEQVTGRTFGPGQDVTGLEFERRFTQDGVDPFDEVEWDGDLAG